MPALRLALAFALIASPALAAGLDGTYCGQLISSGGPAEVVTEFKISPDGGIAGSYTFMDAGKPEPGSLVSRDKASRPTITFLWTDRYGSGRLNVTFDTDYGGFNGQWAVANEQPSLAWTGKRCPPGSKPGVPL